MSNPLIKGMCQLAFVNMIVAEFARLYLRNKLDSNRALAGL
jgi:hypothetical protein